MLRRIQSAAAALHKHEITLVTAALALSIAFGLIPAAARFFALLLGCPK